MGPANEVNATLDDKLNFNFIRDIAPVAAISRESNNFGGRPVVSGKDVPEFIGYARANPGKISMAPSGNGTTPHVAFELFKMMTGVSLVHVPYRGGAPALTDLLGGQVQVMFAVMSSSIAYIRAGKLRALTVTTAQRSEAWPDMPTVGDSVPGYEVFFLLGIGPPRNPPVEVIDKLNKEINACLANPVTKARFADLAATVCPDSAAEFGKLIADETEKVGQGNPRSQHQARVTLRP